MLRHTSIFALTICTILLGQTAFAELPIQRASFKPVKLSSKLIPIQLVENSEEKRTDETVSTLERIKSMVPGFGEEKTETDLSRPVSTVELLPVPVEQIPSKSRLQRLMAKVGIDWDSKEESVEIEQAQQSTPSAPDQGTHSATSQDANRLEFALPRILPSFSGRD